MAVSFRPIGDRVFVEVEHQDERVSGGGIVLVNQDKREPTWIGKVIAVGQGWTQDRHKGFPEIKCGDRIVFSRHAGIQIGEGKPVRLLLDMEHIRARVES